jgi:hypothetical protein
MRLSTILLLCSIGLTFTGCSMAGVNRLLTGLPPEVTVTKDETFKPWLANQMATIVVLSRSITSIDQSALTRQLTDVADGELIKFGYPILTGQTLPKVLSAQSWHSDPAQFDPLPIAKEVGAQIAMVISLTELTEYAEYDNAGKPLRKVRFNAVAKAIGVNSGRVGWVATATGEATPRDGGMQFVANEVVRALMQQFPAKTPPATP